MIDLLKIIYNPTNDIAEFYFDETIDDILTEEGRAKIAEDAKDILTVIRNCTNKRKLH